MYAAASNTHLARFFIADLDSFTDDLDSFTDDFVIDGFDRDTGDIDTGGTMICDPGGGRGVRNTSSSAPLHDGRGRSHRGRHGADGAGVPRQPAARLRGLPYNPDAESARHAARWLYLVQDRSHGDCGSDVDEPVWEIA
jgi:hypothetical protein